MSAIASVVMDNDGTHVTITLDNGGVYRREIVYADAVTSIIPNTGQEKVLELYYDTDDSVYKAVRTDGESQAVEEISTGYVKDSEFTTDESILVASGAGTFAEKTPTEYLAILSGEAGATFNWNGQQLQNLVSPYVIKTSAYTTTVDDEVIGVDTTFGVVTITLGSAACRAGQKIVIKDEGGYATTQPITIATEGAETIDGSATDTIDRNSHSRAYYSNGTRWLKHSTQDDHEVYGLLEEGAEASLPLFGTIGRLYWADDTDALWRDTGSGWVEIIRGEGAIRLAQLFEKAHSSLTGLLDDDHTQYVKVTDVLITASGEHVFSA